MKKPIIAVDIDDTLFPHFGDLISWYNANFGTSLTEYDNHPTDPENWGTDDVTVAIKRVQQFFRTEEFKNAKPFDNVQRVLSRLSERYELIVITARDDMIEQTTHKWLRSHFKDVFHEVHFTNNFSLHGKKRAKADIMKGLGVAYLIDDSLEHCSAAAQGGVEAILFGNYDWNQADLLPIGITRCLGWNQVQEYFDGKS